MPATCFHCGSPLPGDGAVSEPIGGEPRAMCCGGCAAAARFIAGLGLERYYHFRTSGTAAPAPDAAQWGIYDRKAALRRYTHLRPDGSCEVSVAIEGVRCAACSWLIRNVLERLPGVAEVTVRPTDGRAQIRYQPSRCTLSALLETIERLGYRPRPVDYLHEEPRRDGERRAALRRIAVAGLGMMQVMSFAAALYAGALDGIAPDLEQLLRYVSFLVATPVVLYAAYPFYQAAVRNLRHGALGMDVPVAVSIVSAYLWSAWATLRGQGAIYFDSAVMFTFLLLLGRYIEMTLRHRAGHQRESLGRLLPERVLRMSAGVAETVTPEELQVGDRMRILPGERVAADAMVVSGTSDIDEALLTGESAPRLVRCGEQICAGTVNLTGVLEADVTRVGGASTLAAVGRLLDRANADRPVAAQFADQVAAVFVAAVLVLALVIGLLWWRLDPGRAFPAVLAVLVASCPCALSLATPAALAAAIAQLARSGLLVTRSRPLQALAAADVIVFDKTGTLTRGQPRIEKMTLVATGWNSQQCRELAASLEACSTHPIARAFELPTRGDSPVTNASVTPGQGIEGWFGGVRYRIGAPRFVRELLPAAATPAPSDPQAARTHIWLGSQVEGLLAVFELQDSLRDSAANTLRQLHDLGLAIRIASGDRAEVVTAVARSLGVAEAQGGMSPADKVALVHGLQQAGQRVVVVGDGINDAPVLAAADVSIAMGSGTDLARVSADLILVGDSLRPLAQAIGSARRMTRVIRENLLWAAVYNLVAIPLAATGWLQPWTAAVGMSLSSLLVVANALRIRLPARRRGVGSPQPPAGEAIPA
ncbi:MAG: heavy metal translocating P-type ATPase [Proteobacteria bacterium]|nr:heavy metal translocating P-type ATPase [Pseudomonadota bacterium]